MNGDDSVAAIYINRTVLRGCLSSNLPYPGGNEDGIYYSIEGALGDHKYKLKVCERFS